LKFNRKCLIDNERIMTHFEKKLCEIKPEAWTLTPRILVRIQVPQPILI
jgi:hypothetical protein